jgi:hypothetical protein
MLKKLMKNVARISQRSMCWQSRFTKKKTFLYRVEKIKSGARKSSL